MKRKLTGVIISLITFFVCAELFSLVWYYFSQGEIFYFSQRPELALESSGSEALLTQFRLHPYTGFVSTPGGGRNNHGFYFSQDYPYAKSDPSEYLIGIFGGSVAEGFGLQGKKELVQRLRQHPFFSDKKIIVLNFALGGYKQPQQLLLLNYYLTMGQELDMVINIDGFNEVALANLNNENGVDISLPSVHHMASLIGLVDQSTLTGEKIESLAKINRYKTWANTLAGQMNRTRLASVYFLLKQGYKIFHERYVAEKTNFGQLASQQSSESMLYFYPAKKPLEPAVLFKQIALEWANASILMDQILKSKGIPYFHFLQPNQYYSKKKFGAAEAKIALNENQPYRAGVEKGYSLLLDEGKRLKVQGVDFYSAVDIFDKEAEVVYIDDCCHYNQLGNDILADFIADAILSKFALLN